MTIGAQDRYVYFRVINNEAAEVYTAFGAKRWSIGVSPVVPQYFISSLLSSVRSLSLLPTLITLIDKACHDQIL